MRPSSGKVIYLRDASPLGHRLSTVDAALTIGLARRQRSATNQSTWDVNVSRIGMDGHDFYFRNDLGIKPDNQAKNAGRGHIFCIA